jgi:tetratricopeptide (TPR) repeat protein
MALFGSRKQSILNAAIKQTKNARETEGAKADQLYISAYEGFANVVKGDLVTGEALFNWGFALLHQAKSKSEDEGVKLYLDAISKFTFCSLVTPDHLGAAIDGGVAYMDLARILGVEGSDELYDLAGEFFENAERIQQGSAAYNLACIYALRGQKDACLEALELSKESGSLPAVEDMKNDSDLVKVKNMPWFKEFLEKMVDPEPEVVDKTKVSYDVEGNVVGKKRTKQKFATEYASEDGNIYDVEGNVIGQVEPSQSEKGASTDSKSSKETAESAKVTEKK